MKIEDIQPLEIDLLLEAIFQRHGHDFRSYARASISRRIREFMEKADCESIAEMIPRVLHDVDFFSRLLPYFSIPVTEMFRDPFVYRALREKVIPLLRTYPFIKVWHAGCATGEEVYSLAILLKEENLYERTTIYATDFNDAALEDARAGVYPKERMEGFARGYQEAGGNGSFTDYYRARNGAAALDSSLRDRITFANHNLATDSEFGEMHLIFCRNVVIYFNRDLQDRVYGLFSDSLTRGGFLCLGTKEDLIFSETADNFEIVDRAARLYKKKRRP